MNISSGNLSENSLQLLGTVLSWIETIASGKAPPSVEFQISDDRLVAGKSGESIGKQLRATADGAESARLWYARSDSRNFHGATWSFIGMSGTDGRFSGEIPTPPEGFISVFIQLQWPPEKPGRMPMQLSTPIALWGNPAAQIPPEPLPKPVPE